MGKRDLFSKLMTKATNATKNGESISSIRIFFKGMKRKKFLKAANKDLKAYYSEDHVNLILAHLQEDQESTGSSAFTVSASEKMNRLYNKSAINNKNADAASRKFFIWEVRKELLCQAALYEAFPEDVFTDEEMLNQFKTLDQKVRNQMKNVKTHMTDKGLGDLYTELLAQYDEEIESYKALLAVLQ